MTTKSAVLSATEAMRKLRELNQGTREVVSERGRILKDFIETHRDEFGTLKVQDQQHKSGELTSMVRMKSPYEWTYFYHGGKFYETTQLRSRLSRANSGPIIVGMLAGEELTALWNSTDFARAVLD